MKVNELLLKGIDLATIAMWITIIGFSLLIYVSYLTSKRHAQKKTAKKKD